MKMAARRIGLAVAVLGLVVGTAGRARAGLVFGGVSSSIATNSSGWSWDGDELTSFRSANCAENPAYFGPGGTDSTTITTTTLNSVTPATLAGIDVFVAPYLSNNNSTSFDSTVVNWFLNGGSLFLLQDSSFTTGSAPCWVSPRRVEARGPRRTGPGRCLMARSGRRRTSRSPAPRVTWTPAPCIARGDDRGHEHERAGHWRPTGRPGLTPRLRRAVILADVDMISNPFRDRNDQPLDSNGKFALNSAAFLASQADANVVTTPEPSTLISAGIAALTGLGCAWRRRGRAATA